MTPEQIKQLIQWLRSASVTEFDFTLEGRQQVCKPKYLLTRDRDYIVSLMSVSDRIKQAISDKKAEVDKYGWKSPSPEWQRAFGYIAGLHMALDLLHRNEKQELFDKTAPAFGDTHPVSRPDRG